jgi:Xaa-Pro aminopeptidase
MSISDQEYKRRYAAIREQMITKQMDCLLIVGLSDDFNRGNIRYVTGFGRGGCCIFPLEGDPVFFVSTLPLGRQKFSRMISAIDLLELKETDKPHEQAVVELSRFYKGNMIGVVGMSCMSVPMHSAVTEKFGKKLIDANEIFESLRSVKSAEEIEKTRVAASIADNIYAMLMKLIRPGLSEFEVYAEVKRISYKMGCEYSFDLIDGAGSSMNMSHYPTEDKLMANGTLFMEITPSYQGYYSQLPVTLPVTGYNPSVKKMVNAWAQTDKAVRSILRPGTKVSDIYHLLINSIREHGFISPFRPGHSIGLDVLDFWSIVESNPYILKSGMMIAIHPSVMLEKGGDACGMGYTYLITDTGAEKLSKVDMAADLLK